MFQDQFLLELSCKPPPPHTHTPMHTHIQKHTHTDSDEYPIVAIKNEQLPHVQPERTCVSILRFI